MRIRIVERAGSTNADLLADTKAPEGDWLVAVNQDAGKGRQGRSWQSLEGNFFGSTLVEVRPQDPPAQALSLAAGLALLEALDALKPDLDFTLKWPNDVLLDGAKLSGILLERQRQRIVIGFGVNLARAPELPDRKVAHLRGTIAPQAFAPVLAGSMSKMIELWRGSSPDAFAKAWMARAHPIGTELHVHAEDGSRVRGCFAGIKADGALLLQCDDGAVTIVRAGDVMLT